LNRFQNHVGFEPAPGKSGETPVFSFKSGVGVSKSGILKLPRLTVCFSHKHPARKGREGVSGFCRKPFVIESISKYDEIRGFPQTSVFGRQAPLAGQAGFVRLPWIS
jgi:hypothetical protein